jgi:nucleoside-diphosphate-sugar epimerase
MHGQPLTITGTGEETRDFAYVGDIVDGLLMMGVEYAAIGEAMNLASATETSVKDLAIMINEITGNEAGVVFGPKRDWDKSNRRLASIEKAKNLIGFEPKMEFRKGLESVHEWLQTNRENIVKSVGPTADLW